MGSGKHIGIAASYASYEVRLTEACPSAIHPIAVSGNLTREAAVRRIVELRRYQTACDLHMNVSWPTGAGFHAIRRPGQPWKIVSNGSDPAFGIALFAKEGPTMRNFNGYGGYRGYGSYRGFGAGEDLATQAAMAMCAAMNGQWNAEANECSVGDQKYKLPDLSPSSVPAGSCPSGQVMTPKGCFPYPGGVEPIPPGQPEPMPTTPPNTPPPVPPAQASVSSTTPEWVLPAIVGIGAIALVAVVVAVK